MSTSDQDPTTGFTERVRPALPVDETTIAPMGSLPDVAMLTRLANEFFRAQPGQGFPTSVAPYSPDAQDMTPALRNPAAGIRHASAFDAGHTIGRWCSYRTECVPVIDRCSGVGALHHGARRSYVSSGSCACSGNGHADRTIRAAQEPGFRCLPLRLPMPEFGAPFPSFEAGVPVLPPLPPLRTEDDAKSALTATSPFYFLENAGGLNGSGMSPVAGPSAVTNVSQYDPRSAAAVMPSSPFSLPMPEFDRALFPSFEEGVPELAPLPPLRNENEARAALTDPSSFYFLDERSLMDMLRSADKQCHVASCGRSAISSFPGSSLISARCGATFPFCTNG